MSIENSIIASVKQLSPEKQRVVLDFAQFLAAKNNRPKPLRSMKGLCADLNIGISSEEIDELRKEMWSTFPRGDF